MTTGTTLSEARQLALVSPTSPLAVPAFVHSYAWASVVPNLHGLPGAVLVSTLAYFPFLYLPIAAQMRRLDRTLEETVIQKEIKRQA